MIFYSSLILSLHRIQARAQQAPEQVMGNMSNSQLALLFCG